MKERIVIEKTKEFRPHPALREGVNCIDTKYCQYEQVPETWEELKELCKDINGDLKLTSDGKIYCYEYLIAENRTPQQMWQIIKNLVGEE